MQFLLYWKTWKNIIYGGGLATKSCPTLAIPWTVVCQAPLSIEFPRQGYWSGLLFPSPGNLPNRGIKPGSPALQAYSLPTELPGLLYGHIISQAVGICLVILWPLLFPLLPSIFHSSENQSIGSLVILSYCDV